jgi:hypothetical protein
MWPNIRCVLAISAASPFHQLCHFRWNKQTNKQAQVSYMNTVHYLAVLTLQQLQASCRSTLLELKVGTFGILLSPQVHRTLKPCIPFTDVILNFFHQSTVYFAFTKLVMLQKVYLTSCVWSLLHFPTLPFHSNMQWYNDSLAYLPRLAWFTE